MNKILVVGASPRKNGNCDLLIEEFVKGAGESAEVIQLRDLEFSPCIGCEGCRKTNKCILNDDMTPLYKKIEESKGIFLISPVHNYNMTAWMKAFVDRMYCYYNFKEPRPNEWSCILAGEGRKAVLAATAEQNDIKDMGFTIEGMQMAIEALGYEVIDKIPVLGVFEKGKVAKTKYLSQAQASGKLLTESINF